MTPLPAGRGRGSNAALSLDAKSSMKLSFYTVVFSQYHDSTFIDKSSFAPHGIRGPFTQLHVHADRSFRSMITLRRVRFTEKQFEFVMQGLVTTYKSVNGTYKPTKFTTNTF
jgi:hypothetical protein